MIWYFVLISLLYSCASCDTDVREEDYNLLRETELANDKYFGTKTSSNELVKRAASMKHTRKSLKNSNTMTEVLNRMGISVTPKSRRAKDLMPQCKIRGNWINPPCMCKPKKEAIDIRKMIEGFNTRVLPVCLEIERCSGICRLANHHCVPLKTDIVEMPVALGEHDVNDNYRLKFRCSSVKLEKHVQCSCKCPLKPEDCNNQQIFNRESCECQCKNPREAQLCREEGKFWDHQTCECICLSSMSRECSTGSYFDLEACRCLSRYDVSELPDRELFLNEI